MAFKKGDEFWRMSKIGPHGKCARTEIRDEIVRVARSITRPVNTLQQELMDPDATRLQVLFNKAIVKGNVAFIKDIMDRAIGKARETIDVSKSETIDVNVLLKDDSRLGKLIAQARNETRKSKQPEMIEVTKDSEACQ